MQKDSKKYKPFRYFDGVTRAMVDRENRKPKQALSEAMRLSLVKSTICTTSQNPVENERDLTIYEPIKEIDELRPVFSAETKGPGLFTMLQQRTWSGEYRIRTRVETMSQRPPINDGPRVSRALSSRGQRKIRESCYYMAECHGGYKTFVTGTFTEDVRRRISMRKTTIQKEISRTMDALQKMYKRGWIMASGKRVAGNSKPLAYCWVVEVPLNKAGEENPHVHLLIDWQVEKNLFKEWSSRIESIWGNGYFHLEKIRDPQCAGAYMAKAAGYLTKASN